MRASGIIMHITSLPSRHGIGTMGKAAYEFVDFLADSRQKYWQLLPLNPLGAQESPYSAVSTFAGNPLLIDLDLLVEAHWLDAEDVNSVNWGKDPERVDYPLMRKERLAVLRKAYERFIGAPNRDFIAFVKEQQSWLQDYALYEALHTKYEQAWTQWPAEIRRRDPDALAACRSEMKYEVAFHYFLQFTFFEQWNKLRNYARKKGVEMIGDVPIYVPQDSADVWANQHLFDLDEEGQPRFVAGCPPDYFSEDGQMWGNPIYRWDIMKAEGYVWWLKRLEAAAQMYDVIRLDHFRGFESYWAIPGDSKTARTGSWQPGPGMDLIGKVKNYLPKTKFIAEDLGFLTPEVQKLLQDSGFPGMKVLQFAFDAVTPSSYLPHFHVQNCICYTGTHDNATLRQWLDEANEADLAFAKDYLALNNAEGYAWGVIRGGMSTVADLFMAQMQDYLGLGKSSRMNVPGTVSPDNWSWRMKAGECTPALSKRIADMTVRYGRAAKLEFSRTGE